MRRHPKFPGRPLPPAPPPPPNAYLHLQPVVLTRLRAEDSYAVAVGDIVDFCEKTALETYEAAKEAGCGEAEAAAAAAESYRNSLPKLDHYGNARLYIAAVARGVCLGYIGGKEARLMLYAAQLAISANRVRKVEL